VRFHHHIFPTNLTTNSLTKSPHKQMAHIFVLFVSQKFVANKLVRYKLTQATLQASLSSSLLHTCDGGNAPLGFSFSSRRPSSISGSSLAAGAAGDTPHFMSPTERRAMLL
jgi:hypothetical protein